MFDDLFRHPGFTILAVAGVAEFAVYAWYQYVLHKEDNELLWAIVDLQSRILDEVS